MSNYRNLIGALFIAIGFFLSWAWTLPNYQATSAIKEVIAEKEAEYQKKRDTLDQIKEWISQYESRQTDIERFQKIIPDKKNTEEVVILLEKIMAESGLSMNSIEISEIKGGSGINYDTLSFTINAGGTYPSLALLLTQLEKNIRLLDVVSVEIAIANESGVAVAGFLNFKLKVSAYVAKEVIVKTNQNQTSEE